MSFCLRSSLINASAVLPSLINQNITILRRAKQTIANTRVNMAFLIAGMSIKHVLGLPVDFGLEFGQVVKCFIPPVDVIVRKWVET